MIKELLMNALRDDLAAKEVASLFAIHDDALNNYEWGTALQSWKDMKKLIEGDVSGI